jgi:hypothetical protein
MNRKNRLMRELLAATLSVIAPAAVFAADADSGAVLTEIVITAQKRAENVESVPIAVTAFSAATRDLLGIESTQDRQAGAVCSRSLQRQDHLEYVGARCALSVRRRPVGGLHAGRLRAGAVRGARHHAGCRLLRNLGWMVASL